VQGWNEVRIPAREVRVGDRLAVSGTAVVETRRTVSHETLLVTETGTRIPMPPEQLVWVLVDRPTRYDAAQEWQAVSTRHDAT